MSIRPGVCFVRSLLVLACLILLASAAFAQGDRGTITGTIADPAGAVVANAEIEARNIDTGAPYKAASTNTGNYTLAQLPAGSYALSVSVPGFKKYVRQGLTVIVAQTLRIDVALEVGSSAESVTVTEAATLLKTESGELSHSVGVQRMDDLPVMGIGASQAGSEGIRNPYAVTQLIPGTYFAANATVRVNGAPSNTQSFRIEGQDASNGFTPGTTQQLQPSVDSIEEFTIQTSNFAAEYGQVGGGYFNATMKSGTNQYHGTAYDYFVNEVLNAGMPFTNDANHPGNLIRPAQRRHDYGFTLGGPVWIPHLYKGRDKTFFFFNFEQFRETQQVSAPVTVPTQAYIGGNFAAALTGRNLCPAATPSCDPLGRPIMEGTIYDISTERAAPNGQLVRDPFAGNIIPPSRMDPVAVAIQKLIPAPTNSSLINNYLSAYPSQRVTGIPSFKIDQVLGAKGKLSFYFSRIGTESLYSSGLGLADGLPLPITAALGSLVNSRLYRLNYDHTLTPTLLFHFGAGFQDVYFNDQGPVSSYDAAGSLGLKGATTAIMFPFLQGLCASSTAVSPTTAAVCIGQGGMKNMGPSQHRLLKYSKPTSQTSLTWVKNNHTFKAGGEYRNESYPGTIFTATNGSYSFSPAETGLPSTNGQSLQGGTIGFAYASFMLGLVDSGQISNPITLRPVKTQWGWFLQDTWKITRKVTLDYGARYDFSTYIQDNRGRFANFSPSALNPSAGNLRGAVIFEGSGPNRCNCEFAHNYPWAYAPRLGLAYQIMPKTVFRAGWGIVYGGTADSNGAVSRIGQPSPFSSPAYDEPAMTLRGGLTVQPFPWPNFNPGQYPLPGTTTAPQVAIDQNAGRPPRQYQWSAGLQREIFRNLAVEAAYVGNRGVWWNAPALIDVNGLTPQILAEEGLNLNNAADRTLLTSPMNSAVAASRGFNRAPYSGFPLSSPVAQSLRPFPQFGSLTYLWSPLGKTWYDSLQAKVTQRFSHGLSYTSAFTWQKSLTSGAEQNVIAGAVGGASVNDVFNRGQNKYISQYSQPFVLNLAANYIVPVFNVNKGSLGKALSWVARDWTLGAFLQYASGLPILSPYGTNGLNSLLLRNAAAPATGTFANRVPGVPLYTNDINCHCFDPAKTFILNPGAWTQPAAGQFGSAAAYYADYRFQRRPVENMSLGRIFRIRERATVNLRMEFTNVFNRTEMNNPTSTNAQATQTATAGFGYISTATTFSPPRQGSIVARFQF
jgi:hypothetical protein